jgi:drug/metabolite transporter (DMT)-like permease
MNWLWIPFTVVAAAGQTARNAMQRELTASLGAVGATHVRFLFGFPFALLFLAGVTVWTRGALPHPGGTFWFDVVGGAITQIAGTALMLLTMAERSFVVTVAYLKTEPIFVAIFGFLFLHDVVTPLMAIAILITTAGVVLISLRRGVQDAGAARPALLGLTSGAMFALSAIGYRGAIQSLGDVSFVMRATFALAMGLTFQALLLTAYLAIRDPRVLRSIVRMWRPSLFAGFMGALASEFWFLAFALANAASVRTLGSIDVLFAQGTQHIVFKERTTWIEAIGIVLVIVGTVLIAWAES